MTCNEWEAGLVPQHMGRGTWNVVPGARDLLSIKPEVVPICVGIVVSNKVGEVSDNVEQGRERAPRRDGDQLGVAVHSNMNNPYVCDPAEHHLLVTWSRVQPAVSSYYHHRVAAR